MPASKHDPGAWGTATYPLVMSPYGWEHLHPFLITRMEHVHLYDGGRNSLTCVHNVFGPLCEEPS